MADLDRAEEMPREKTLAERYGEAMLAVDQAAFDRDSAEKRLAREQQNYERCLKEERELWAALEQQRRERVS